MSMANYYWWINLHHCEVLWQRVDSLWLNIKSIIEWKYITKTRAAKSKTRARIKLPDKTSHYLDWKLNYIVNCILDIWSNLPRPSKFWLGTVTLDNGLKLLNSRVRASELWQLLEKWISPQRTDKQWIMSLSCLPPYFFFSNSKQRQMTAQSAHSIKCRQG